jgi:ATP-dependent RNA helicase RhlE
VSVGPDNGGIKGKRPSKKDKLRAAAAAAAAAGDQSASSSK